MFQGNSGLPIAPSPQCIPSSPTPCVVCASVPSCDHHMGQPHTPLFSYSIFTYFVIDVGWPLHYVIHRMLYFWVWGIVVDPCLFWVTLDWAARLGVHPGSRGTVPSIGGCTMCTIFLKLWNGWPARQVEYWGRHADRGESRKFRGMRSQRLAAAWATAAWVWGQECESP